MGPERRVLALLLAQRRLAPALAQTLRRPQRLAAPFLWLLEQAARNFGSAKDAGWKPLDLARAGLQAFAASPVTVQPRRARAVRHIVNRSLTQLSRRGDTAGAATLLRELQTARLQPDEATLSIAVGLVAQAPDPVAAEAAYEGLVPLLEQIQVSADVLNSLLMPLCGGGEAAAAVLLVQRMRRIGARRDDWTYNIALKACVAAARNERMPVADAEAYAASLLRFMAQDGIPMNEYTFHQRLLLAAERDEGSNMRVMEILDEMDACGVVANLRIFTAAIQGLVAAKDYDSVRVVLQRMSEIGIQPDRNLWTLFLHTYAEDGNAEELEQVLMHMEAHGLPMDTRAYNQLITAALTIGAPEYAMAVVRQMHARGVPFDMHTESRLTMLGLDPWDALADRDADGQEERR